MRRRRFLIGLGVAALAGLGAIGLGRVGAEAQIASYVRRRLGFLRLDEAGLQAFARDQMAALLAKRPSLTRLKYHFLSVYSPAYSRLDRSSDTRSRLARVEDAFVSTYLLSSDFFTNGADPARPVHYVRFYDPLRPCGNPFARPPPGHSNPMLSR